MQKLTPRLRLIVLSQVVQSIRVTFSLNDQLQILTDWRSQATRFRQTPASLSSLRQASHTMESSGPKRPAKLQANGEKPFDLDRSIPYLQGILDPEDQAVA